MHEGNATSPMLARRWVFRCFPPKNGVLKSYSKFALRILSSYISAYRMHSWLLLLPLGCVLVCGYSAVE